MMDFADFCDLPDELLPGVSTFPVLMVNFALTMMYFTFKIMTFCI